MSSQEQPENQPADEQPESADEQPESAEPDPTGSDKAPEATGEPASSPEDERLEALGEHIEAARAQAEDAGVIEDHEQEEEYADSGATPSEDDQTITPPG